MRDLDIRDITVDDVQFRIVFSLSRMCPIQAGFVGVYHDDVKVLTLYKPTAEQMVARIRRAIDACGFIPVAPDDSHRYYTCNRCGVRSPGPDDCPECE